MFQIGDLVICSDTGVCRVESIGKIDMPWIDKNRLYYTLHPVYKEGKLYVPIDTDIFMRPVVTYEETQQLIDSIPVIQAMDCAGQDHKTLKEYYSKLLHTHNCKDLIKLIKTIYEKNIITKSNGKQPGQIDSKFIKQAEDSLYSEFAIALDIPKEQVKEYIESKINEIENVKP